MRIRLLNFMSTTKGGDTYWLGGPKGPPLFEILKTRMPILNFGSSYSFPFVAPTGTN